MDTQNIETPLQTVLAATIGADWSAAAATLLSALGYSSERTLLGQTGDPVDFVRQFPSLNPGTQSERGLLEATQSVHVLFQFTGYEVKEQTQPALFDAADFDSGNARSFLFAAVQLRGHGYSRGRYASLTRELNRHMQLPMVVLFRTLTGHITLTFVHRRPNRRDPDRDVLGNVSLIREIDAADPHRAHLDILANLSLHARLKWMNDHGRSYSFDGLLDAWLDALDTEELNRRFYRELYNWFEKAVETAKFADAGATRVREEHVIRLITRLLFVWFVKEKGLIAGDLFIENRVGELLKDYDRASGDSYYRAVLQNLFFATLNTEICDRRFIGAAPSDQRNFSLFRYRTEMNTPDALVNLFNQTPFINGGLFDCLDNYDATGTIGIDCFEDDAGQRAGFSIPNRLFFGEGGLITLFNRYKFTVEENTPAEREVALDPELLGRVFENLLAAFNPETRENVRKKTGSYYTPRVVVDYMVDEALVAMLSQKATPADGDAEFWQARLRYLLDYDVADAEVLFEETEREDIVRSIAETKVLDPAVGSGAFPMGILHKLTLALRRLDPENELWEKLQKELAGRRAASAFDTADQLERDAELRGISATFEHYRGSDFGRKLYLIQNGIYGVDIQPIATQIAKLRFFISLAIEQQSNDDAGSNYGIKPLPNLETRFVAADSLLTLRGSQGTLSSERVLQLQRQLRDNRERYFHANTRALKDRCRVSDQALRADLAGELKRSGLATGEAAKVAAWDPFNQNGRATWFDAEYMFGVVDGFDVVIGNPPYVESRNSLLTNEKKDAYQSQVLVDWGEELPRGSDLLIYFLARAPKFLRDAGHGYLITQNAWLSTDYGKKFQDFSLSKFAFQRIIDTSAKFFSDGDGPQINAVIAVFGNRLQDCIDYEIVDSSMAKTAAKRITAGHSMKWGHLAAMPDFFIGMLTEMRARNELGAQVAFGQGLNFSLNELYENSGGRPVIVKDVKFVATSADGGIRANRISSSREGKVPALIMPRGIGDRQYCTFNACKAFSNSAVELYLPDALWGSKQHYCLWAYLNSSLVWLFRETTGRRNLGGGMLKAEATDMKALPINFDFDFADKAKGVLEALKSRAPLPLAQEICTDEHLAIDQMVFDYFGFSDMQGVTRSELIRQVVFRTGRPNQSA